MIRSMPETDSRGRNSRRSLPAMTGRIAVGVFLLSGPALAQEQPGDAKFCSEYAETAATAAEDAIARNPACLDYGSGVHGDRTMHVEWCARTARDKVEGAAVHIRRLASRCTKGALVTPTEYGGYDIVGGEQFERPYGQARQWQVKAAFSGRTFMYCVAETGANERAVRLGFDLAMPGESGQWQLAVPVKAKKDWQGRLEIDGAEPAGRAGADVSGAAVGAWTIAWLNMGHVDALRQGHAAVLGVGKADYDFSLEGVAAAITKIEECRSRKGAGASAAAPSRPVAQAAPPQDSAVVNAPVTFAPHSKPGLCVRHPGGSGPGSSELELSRCDASKGVIFLLEDRGGPIRLSDRTDSCASVNRLPSPPENVMIIPCRDSTDRWRYDERSRQIRNGDNYCWTVEGRAFRAGAKIIGEPCRPNAPEQQFERQF